MSVTDVALIKTSKDKINCESKRRYFYIKRSIDVLLSMFSLIFLAPFLAILYLIVKIDSKGPFIYKHKRLGKNGKIIEVYKIRTMKNNSAELFKNFTKEQKEEFEKYYKLENDPRITRVGKFLRKTSLDELPQLINILKGEMSLIGPRPVVEKEIEKFGNKKEEYLSVLPGLTGWWACNGRSDIDYDERIELEMYYIDNFSFKLDLICFFKTIKSVLKRSGAK